MNGRIKKPGDVDMFHFKGRAGEKVVAEVYARRLHSPLDSLLRLMDASGKVLEWNDDCENKGEGLLTHHADSYLRAELPKDGVYFVQLSDAQHHGGDEYAYRLRMSEPRPDFALRIAPSSVTLRASRTAAVTVYALRKDDFAGDIEVQLKDAPPGFTISGSRIPAGCDHIRMTLTAAQALDGPVALQLEGYAKIGEETVSRPVVPCENMMQAFAYWHLFPSQQLLATTMGGRGRAPKIEVANEGPVRIPEGGTAQVLVKAPKAPMLEGIQLELSEAPKGVTLQEVTSVPEGLALLLKADGSVVKAGYADNLIVEAIKEANPPANVNRAKQKQRISLGVLPAIPFEIVQK